MTDVDFVQWGPQRDYSDVKITTTHASTEGDETRWVVVGETASWGSPRTEVERIEAEMNRDTYCERFMRGEG